MTEVASGSGAKVRPISCRRSPTRSPLPRGEVRPGPGRGRGGGRTVSGTRLLQFATRGWNEADLGLSDQQSAPHSGDRLLAGNDPRLGGLAEARSGAARTAGVALHILVAEGVGGVLLARRSTDAGTRGAGGNMGTYPSATRSSRAPAGTRMLGPHGRRSSTRSSPRDDQPSDPTAYAAGSCTACSRVKPLILGISEQPTDRARAGCRDSRAHESARSRGDHHRRPCPRPSRGPPRTPSPTASSTA